MKRGHIPVRMCVICRRRAPQAELLRHSGRIGEPCPDGDARRPGRGWYVCAEPRCLEKLGRYGARKRKKEHPEAVRSRIARTRELRGGDA